MTRARCTLIALFLCGIFATSSAHAAGSWDWTLGIYLWGSDVSLDMAVDGEPVLEVDAEFSDLLSKVDFAGSLHLEGLRGKWGLMTDLFYIDLSDSGQIPPPGPLGQSVSYQMDMQLLIFEAGALYSPSGSSEGFALFGGIRVLDVDQSLRLDLPLPNDPSLQLGISSTLVDGMLGARYTGKFSERWGLLVRGDLAAGGTDLTWNLLGLLMVEFGQTGKYGAVFGYRQMEIEIEEREDGTVTNTDMTMAGPIAAFVIRFGRG